MTSETSTLVTVGTHLNGDPLQLNLEQHPHVLVSASNTGNQLLHTIQNQLEHRNGWGVLVLNLDTTPNLRIADQVMTALAEACEERTEEHKPLILVVMENADDLLLLNGDDQDAAKYRYSMLVTLRRVIAKAHEAGIYFLLSFRHPDMTILNAGVRPHIKNRFTVGHHGSIHSTLILDNVEPSTLPPDDITTGYAVINGELIQFNPASN